jgi:NADH:ubiquinone oxidoreductase subunit 5 (subunit L)/multisubunit Na+/H+ antiporter MnhA subunit
LKGITGEHSFSSFVEHSVLHLHTASFQPHIAIVALSLGLGAIFLARSIYGQNRALNQDGKDPLAVNASFASFFALANARLYWDEFYFMIFIRPYQVIGAFLADVIDWRFLHDYFHDTVIYRGYHTIGQLLSQPFDLGIIDGIVNGVAWLVNLVSGRTSRIQTG